MFSTAKANEVLITYKDNDGIKRKNRLLIGWLERAWQAYKQNGVWGST